MCVFLPASCACLCEGFGAGDLSRDKVVAAPEKPAAASAAFGAAANADGGADDDAAGSSEATIKLGPSKKRTGGKKAVPCVIL